MHAFALFVLLFSFSFCNSPNPYRTYYNASYHSKYGVREKHKKELEQFKGDVVKHE
jgi:hypothetical protein